MTSKARPDLGSVTLSSQLRAATLLRATTDAFVEGLMHDREATRHFEELATHFLARAPLADRMYVAEALADRADVPQSVLRLLARDDAAVAGPVLLRSAGLGTIDLLAVIGSCGPEHHRLIARRPDLPEDVVTALTLAGDGAVRAILEQNAATSLAADQRWSRPRPSERPTRAAIEPAAEPALKAVLEPFLEPTLEPAASSDAAAPVAVATAVDQAGDPVPEMVGGDGFLALDRPARLALIADIATRRIRPVERSVPRRLQAALRQTHHAARLADLARRGRVDAVAALLAEGLALDPALARRMVADPSGEPLVLVMRAIGLPAAEAGELLLLANPAIGRSVDDFYRLSDLFAAMEPFVAESLVAAWRGEPVRGERGHAPYLAEAEGARPRASEQRKRPAEEKRSRARADRKA